MMSHQEAKHLADGACLPHTPCWTDPGHDSNPPLLAVQIADDPAFGRTAVSLRHGEITRDRLHDEIARCYPATAAQLWHAALSLGPPC